MKTTVKTLAAFGVLVLSGVISATGSEKTVAACKMVKSLEVQITATSAEITLDETSESVNYQKEAQLVTRFIADREEAKAIQKIMNRCECGDRLESDSALGAQEVQNYAQEARDILKAWADDAEIKAINQLCAGGKMFINR